MSLRALPASSIDLEGLVELWNLAYAGYFVPMSWGVAQLDQHVRAGSIDLDRSLVWRDGEQPVALSLLGIRPARPGSDGGHSSAGGVASCAHHLCEHGLRGWVGGFGVVPSHRGRGLATRLMREHLDLLRHSGLRHVQLEVLTQNWAAKSYERAGFTTTRRLLVLQGELASPHEPGRQGVFADPSQVPDLIGQLDRLHAAYAPAWTREGAGLPAVPDGLRCLTVGAADDLDAVALVREGAGTVQVLDAVARDGSAARTLVAGLAHEHAGRVCRLVNEPEGSPLVDALAEAGVREVMAQYEMHWHA